VLVLCKTLLPLRERGVEYANHGVVLSKRFVCRVLIVARYSQVPTMRCGRLIVAASDAPGRAHDHFAPYFEERKNATLVALSAWQRSLFPASWKAEVIPYILPERVYSHEAQADPHRFVYASAALKGLRETLAAWTELKEDPAFVDAQLVVCTPGYDAVDEAALARAGVRFLGSLPFDRVVQEIASSAGLFYVNRFSETFCIVAALAEALRRRVHVLCLSDVGGLRETVGSPLVTTDRSEFFASFRAAYAEPDDPRWHASPRDYHEASVMDRWLRLTGLDGKVEAPVRAGPAPTLCLNMIVKNEAHVIERCLAAVKPIVSHWVIADTGSTDGTQDVIRRAMAGVPGELHERPWKDFAHNRTEAIALASGKGDYLLVVDADDTIEVAADFSPHSLTLDSYELRIEDHGHIYHRTQIFRNDAGYRYEGALHEGLKVPPGRKGARLAGLVYHRIGGGARSRDPERHARDVQVLENALKDDPENSRSVFYLAQSLRDAERFDEALPVYERRTTMGGYAEEVWASYLAIALILERQAHEKQGRGNQGHGDDAVIAAFLRAYEYRPQRAEPLCYLARFLRGKSRFALAHVMATAAVHIPRPAGEQLWSDEAVYAWRSLDEFAISSYYVGRHEDAIRANRRLLADPALPASERARVQKNMEFSTAIVGDK
jgi:glycosyltransferase involved in cell wall biosynthesis